MRLTELILELHTIMLEKGNLDVVLREFDSDHGIIDEPDFRVWVEDGKAAIG